MTGRRSALGRGLEALIPDAPDAARSPTAAAAAGSSTAVRQLPVAAIVPNPQQPRRHFEEADLQTLAESLRRHGVLQPVVVRGKGQQFELVVGERRWRAAQLAGFERIPAIEADIATADRLEVALIENVQRRDLNPIELALAFSALSHAGLTHQEIGQRVGLDRSSVSNHIRLLELSRDVQEDLEFGRIQMGHAKALLSLANLEQRRALRDRVVNDGLSVRQTESAVQGGGAPRKGRSAATTPLDPDLQVLVGELRSALKTRVRLRGTAARGRIEIDYLGSGDLQRIAAAILDPELDPQ